MAGNYRPIALLPIVSKVMERLVHNKVTLFLSPWFAPNQSGFKKKDGTTAQLARITQAWADAVDSGKYVGSVFFDLRKAFDRVWHRGLLAKLQAAGISGAAYQWFASFLADRVQATVVDGSTSAFSALHAGVPQGAILSPLLFSIYMNDIPYGDSTNLFADDTSSYVVAPSPSVLCCKLQERTDGLAVWFSKWLLSVNSSKSAVMVFRSKKMQPVTTKILIDSATIPQVSSHRHLGVIFNDRLTWSDHVSAVITSASAKIGFLRRLGKRLDPLVLRELYLCCIRPAIEYASVVWAGLSSTDSQRLERCNRSAARLVTRLSPSADVNHDVLLARAGLQSLSSRRQAEQAKFCYRAIAGRLPLHLQSAVSAWLPAPSAHQMARREASVRLPRPQKNVLKKSPFYAAFSSWNSLPFSLRSSATLASLRSHFSS